MSIAKYQAGDTVGIASDKALNQFARVWNRTLHPSQVAFAGQAAKVVNILHNNGHVFYELENQPGIWHEGLLLPFGKKSAN